MTDLELARTLFVSEDGEVRSYPEYAGKDGVRESLLLRPRFYVAVPPDEAVVTITTIWHPVSRLNEALQVAFARLYREREAARDLAIAWYWNAIRGSYIRPPGSLNELIQKSKEFQWIKESKPPKDV